MLKRRLKEPFGKAGLVVGVIALVFAMLGGAYAASNNGGGKATASAKAKQGKQGKQGKTGPAGPAGPAGATGPAGPKGDAGSAGASGISVKNEAEPKGANCAEGGSKFVATATTYACNGKEGSPWSAGGVLPKGKTETGVWSGNIFNEGASESGTGIPISFPIPVANAPEGVLVTEAEGSAPGCAGVVSGTPKAAEGKLCLYEGVGPGSTIGEAATFDLFTTNISPVGAYMTAGCAEFCQWRGVWAVTAG